MLVVIDVQEYYLDEFRKQEKRFNKMITGLKIRVQQAVKRREPVINLTTFGDGFTLPEIIELIELSKKSHFVTKWKDDGSNSLHKLIKRKKIFPKSIELCGCFRDVCVLETWKGLKKLGYNMLPVKKALTIPTFSRWRGIKKYPAGYLEEKMEFDTEQDNITQMKKVLQTDLPKENELIITKGGLIILDEEGPVRPEDLGEPVGDSILCGC